MMWLEIPGEKRIIGACVIPASTQRGFCNKPTRKRKAEVQTACQEYMKSTLRIHPWFSTMAITPGMDLGS